MAQNASRWLRDGPKTAPRSPKLPQEPPKRSQEAPKCIQKAPTWLKDGSKMPPKWRQDGPKSVPEWHQVPRIGRTTKFSKFVRRRGETLVFKVHRENVDTQIELSFNSWQTKGRLARVLGDSDIISLGNIVENAPTDIRRHASHFVPPPPPPPENPLEPESPRKLFRDSSETLQTLLLQRLRNSFKNSHAGSADIMFSTITRET